MYPILKLITASLPVILALSVGVEKSTLSNGLIEPPPLVENEEIDPLSLLNPILIPVCGCESAGSPTSRPVQFHTDGSVVRGRINNLDIGSCQINLYYWEDEAKRLGLDIFKEKDNYLMANHILETQGINAWIWSNDCHHALD